MYNQALSQYVSNMYILVLRVMENFEVWPILTPLCGKIYTLILRPSKSLTIMDGRAHLTSEIVCAYLETAYSAVDMFQYYLCVLLPE